MLLQPPHEKVKSDVACHDDLTSKSHHSVMSECTHKRKRSLQDSTIDLSKMTMVLNRLEALKEELDGVEEAEEELRSISEHVLALQNILRGAKKPRFTFYTVALEDLKNAGVKRRRLMFDAVKVRQLMNGQTAEVEAEIADLHCRIKKIYAHVNMDYEPGSRMILDAILLTVAEIASRKKTGVAILPEMKIAQGDGVQVSHPDSGFELWLSGNVDYAVVQYEEVMDFRDRLLAPGGSREDAFEFAKGRLFLVEAKRQNPDHRLVSYIPEAVSQAIAVLKTADLPEIRFCLSDGYTWIFFILKSQNGTLTYYDSAPRRLSRDIVEHSDLLLRELVGLVCEWLNPTMSDPFILG